MIISHSSYTHFSSSHQLSISVYYWKPLETCDHCGEDIEALYMKNSSLLGHRALESKISFNKITVVI